MKQRKLILIIVFLLVIGFSVISRTLILNGGIGITNKTSDFKIIFINAILDGKERKDFIEGSSKQTINYETKKLININETATLGYEVANTSRLYDAKVIVSCESDKEGYISMEYIPNNMIVEAGQTKSGSITAKLVKSSPEDKSISIKCELKATAIERESLGEEYIPTYKITFNTDGGEPLDSSLTVKQGQNYGELPIPTREKYEFLGWYTSTGDKVDANTVVNLEEDVTLIAKWKKKSYDIVNDINKNSVADVGDEIKIGTENFYVISNNGTNVNALAKYNLYLGNIYTSDLKLAGTLPSTGIQNASAVGHLDSSNRYIGTVAFANSQGWPYSNNDTIIIKNYNGPVKTALYDSNGYENYIKKTIPDATVRLITISEVRSLTSYSWLYNTSYWTESASTGIYNGVWIVATNHEIEVHGRQYPWSFGVRPVVTVPA